ncbi:Cytoplasm to vacuole targeting protein-like protein Vps64 [Venustampulla echinocandica]|uniref:Cytoplasm to vacuole targeting protein-like protein Vps64 n=1 Tax=Venustampulla echinocandica TaxID=2656787 RepID=A0A370TK83_9HELO|nr:Cytoplasm to vacuole targeting protein-like protein Vps64 [Venustampulla echinocandica]RDL35928.1 Cytoplasm to vacuole targeting protein-like protein Vps64 [Venustampulla echinocandica]
MTAVANPPSFQPNNRSPWGANVGQGGLNSMNPDEVARMFMPRKSAQRANSSSSIASTSSTSSTTTISQPSPHPQTNGVPMQLQSSSELNSWGTAAARKKPQRAVPWPANKSEAIAGVSTARPQPILTTSGPSTGPSTMSSLHQPSAVVSSQHALQNPSQQVNGTASTATPVGEGNPVLYLLSMNSTFERKTISVPYYPDSLRIGRQTNAKTVPTPANGFFDSKVLSRQHAEIWADRNGKVYIRDVKSSNGTFVNGSRLSAENRDSEPHELQTSDHLELGIDIVSEDQKTVVHHKVAAKVEHAGFLGATNNVLDMNFGDLDPANGAMMLPSQGSMQMRGRSSSQGSVGSNGRMGPPASAAGSHMSVMGQQRPMNFWLTPVTTEQIVKRLTHEMRIARLQTHDLGRADNFLGSLVTKNSLKEIEKQSVGEPVKAPQVNGAVLPFRTDAKPRFSDPPAPPPQQPLPEKPDVTRPHTFEPSSPSLKRSNTERPRSVPNASPVRQESPSQIITLVEALASAKKEIDSQSARLQDLEETLQKERQARELAEELVKRLEAQSEVKTEAKAHEGSIIEEAFEPPTENSETRGDEPEKSAANGKVVDPNAISQSTLLLEKRLESMLGDMQELKDQMESFKQRAETAEAERDAGRTTLAEMVEEIRANEATRRSSSTERTRSLSTADASPNHALNGKSDEPRQSLGSLLRKDELVNRNIDLSPEKTEPGGSTINTLSRRPGGRDPLLYHATPYASMLGVVVIGMGIMAYLNGWQPPKVDR